MGGAIIDGLIMMALSIPIMMVLGTWQAIMQGQRLSYGSTILYSILGIGIFLAINGYFLAKQGQTIGKIAVKTRIVDLNGNICPFAKMFVLRYVVLWAIHTIPIIGNIVGLVDVLFIFGKEKRCIHDYIAGTKVVDA